MLTFHKILNSSALYHIIKHLLNTSMPKKKRNNNNNEAFLVFSDEIYSAYMRVFSKQIARMAGLFRTKCFFDTGGIDRTCPLFMGAVCGNEFARSLVYDESLARRQFTVRAVGGMAGRQRDK